MKCETLTELNSTIEQIIAKYEVNKYIDDGSIWPLTDQPDDVRHMRSIDPNAEEWLKTKATKVRTCVINIFQQNPQLPEPPKPESEPLIELQQIRQWCIRAEAPTQPKQNQPASGEKADLPNEKPAGTGPDIAPSKLWRKIAWLKNHPHSYSLTGGVIFLVLFLVVGLFKPQWRQWCWGVACLAFLVLVLSLLGGRSR